MEWSTSFNTLRDAFEAFLIAAGHHGAQHPRFALEILRRYPDDPLYFGVEEILKVLKEAEAKLVSSPLEPNFAPGKIAVIPVKRGLPRLEWVTSGSGTKVTVYGVKVTVVGDSSRSVSGRIAAINEFLQPSHEDDDRQMSLF